VHRVPVSRCTSRGASSELHTAAREANEALHALSSAPREATSSSRRCARVTAVYRSLGFRRVAAHGEARQEVKTGCGSGGMLFPLAAACQSACTYKAAIKHHQQCRFTHGVWSPCLSILRPCVAHMQLCLLLPRSSPSDLHPHPPKKLPSTCTNSQITHSRKQRSTRVRPRSLRTRQVLVQDDDHDWELATLRLVHGGSPSRHQLVAVVLGRICHDVRLFLARAGRKLHLR